MTGRDEPGNGNNKRQRRLPFLWPFRRVWTRTWRLGIPCFRPWRSDSGHQCTTTDSCHRRRSRRVIKPGPAAKRAAVRARTTHTLRSERSNGFVQSRPRDGTPTACGSNGRKARASRASTVRLFSERKTAFTRRAACGDGQTRQTDRTTIVSGPCVRAAKRILYRVSPPLKPPGTVENRVRKSRQWENRWKGSVGASLPLCAFRRAATTVSSKHGV